MLRNGCSRCQGICTPAHEPQLTHSPDTCHRNHRPALARMKSERYWVSCSQVSQPMPPTRLASGWGYPVHGTIKLSALVHLPCLTVSPCLTHSPHLNLPRSLTHLASLDARSLALSLTRPAYLTLLLWFPHSLTLPLSFSHPTALSP